MTMKRAKKNPKLAISQNNWIAKEYEFEELNSAICHLDSLEHYKVPKDPKDLFVLKEKKSHVNTICDEDSLQELSNHDVNSNSVNFQPGPHLRRQPQIKDHTTRTNKEPHQQNNSKSLAYSVIAPVTRTMYVQTVVHSVISV